MRISDWSSDVCSSDLVYRLKTGCCGSRLPNCVKNGTLGGSKPNGSPSPISPLSRSPAPAPASGRACSAARATALADRSEEHTSELQSLMRISYAVFFLKNKSKTYTLLHDHQHKVY